MAPLCCTTQHLSLNLWMLRLLKDIYTGFSCSVSCCVSPIASSRNQVLNSSSYNLKNSNGGVYHSMKVLCGFFPQQICRNRRKGLGNFQKSKAVLQIFPNDGKVLNNYNKVSAFCWLPMPNDICAHFNSQCQCPFYLRCPQRPCPPQCLAHSSASRRFGKCPCHASPRAHRIWKNSSE